TSSRAGRGFLLLNNGVLNHQGNASVPAGVPMLRLEDVQKTYGRGAKQVQALRGVSIDVMPGEIFGIIGLSGAGKSTLIRCINLLERPQAGRVFIDGVDVTGYKGKALRTVRRQIGMVFQHFNLLTNRTALANVSFPMEIVGIPKNERERRGLELLEFVGLREKAHRYPARSEEHTSELQSRENLVCRLLLEKKKK